MKRCSEIYSPDGATKKRPKIALTDEECLNDFNEWMSKSGFLLNKVSVTKRDVCSGWGVVADKNIKRGEVIFVVPQTAFLIPENSELEEVIQTGKDELKSKSGWIPLLLALMHEYTSENSNWRPYFNMVPNFEVFDMPMFWDKDEINVELQGTSLNEAIFKDLASLTEEFNCIVLPFVMKYPLLFDPSRITMELFKKMVAFVMAYSFTKPSRGNDGDSDVDSDDEGSSCNKNPPIMIPLADILNHVSRNNAYLEFKHDCVNMIASRDIMEGEEILNTYGELSNGQLLHMYGFAEEPSVAAHDTVDASSLDLYNILLEEISNVDLLKRKWTFLLKTGAIPTDGSFVLGHEGVLTEEHLLEVFKVLDMTEEELELAESEDGWLSDNDEDGYESPLSIENISKLNPSLKRIIHRWTDLLIRRYPKTLREEENVIMTAHKSKENSLKSRRKLFSSYVRCGHLQILEKFRDFTK